MGKKYITEVEGSLKTLRKQVSEVERHLRNLRETEVSLGHWEPELERLRKSADIQNDSHIDDLSRAKQRIDICKDVLKSAPAFLEEPIRKAVSGIDVLNDILRAAARDEREQLIQDATVALGPFAGTRREDELNGAVSNPARKIAETLPILQSIPSDASNLFKSASTDNMEHRGYVQVAESVLSTAREAITVADAWIKAGGKFCTSKLQ